MLVGGTFGALLVVSGLTRRLVVEGSSMAPTLSPGDHVVAVRHLPLRPGHIVAARDPRQPARVLVKRVAEVAPDGALLVAGDNPEQSTDSRDFGPISRTAVVGRVIYRYAPVAQRGALSSIPPATRW